MVREKWRRRAVTALLLLALTAIIVFAADLWSDIESSTRARQEQAGIPDGGSVLFLSPEGSNEWFVYSEEAGAFVPLHPELLEVPET